MNADRSVFNLLILKNLISKLSQMNIGLDRYIKFIEYVRGIYRYPTKMLGRNISEDLHRSTDILVIAAHPDDEILGLGATLHRHRKDGDKIMVTYVTNGTAGEGASWKTKVNDSKIIAEVRFNEGLKGLKLLDILERNILCLGYPDAGTHRYLKNIARDLNKLIKKTKPKRIYVHCIEGGHSDHDITSFVVKSVCKKLKFDNVFEWAEYNQIQPLGTRNINFANSRPTNSEVNIIDISDEEYKLKKEMLNCHESQGVVEHYLMGEAIRQAIMEDLEQELLNYSLFPMKRLKPLINIFSKFINDEVTDYNVQNKTDKDKVKVLS